MKKSHKTSIQNIPIDRINILNPRERNKRIFRDMMDNITKVGLKRPITVTPCKVFVEGKDYDLVCGQGRLETFIACGEKYIPAIVIDASEEDALIMSLVENLARRNHRPIDLLHGIEILKKNGYDAKAIACKTGLTVEYTNAVLNLLERGEERLLAAVEAGHIPVSVAVRIADSPGDEQQALQEAYENKLLRGKKLLVAKRLLETRRRHGKSITGERRSGRNKENRAISAHEVLKIYHKEVDRKRLIIRKADLVSNRILFVMGALRQLFAEEHFMTVLQAEGLTTLPKQLSLLLEGKS